jgi:hypothetical protein
MPTSRSPPAADAPHRRRFCMHPPRRAAPAAPAIASAIDDLSVGYCARRRPSAQRFSALAHLWSYGLWGGGSGYWGSSAATVAPGHKGQPVPRTAAGGNYPRTAADGPMLRQPHQRAPHGPRREGRGGRCQRDGDGRRGGVDRDPGAHVVTAAWPRERPGLPGTRARGVGPGGAVGAMVAAILMVATVVLQRGRCIVSKAYRAIDTYTTVRLRRWLRFVAS